MRGAVSVALVYFYYDPDGGSVDAEKSTLIAMTLTVVLFSTLVFGAVTKPLLDFMLGPDRAGPHIPALCLGVYCDCLNLNVQPMCIPSFTCCAQRYSVWVSGARHYSLLLSTIASTAKRAA